MTRAGKANRTSSVQCTEPSAVMFLADINFHNCRLTTNWFSINDYRAKYDETTSLYTARGQGAPITPRLKLLRLPASMGVA